MNKLEKLEPEKVYFCQVPDATQEDIHHLYEAYSMASNKMQWTPPQIIFINKQIGFTDVEELKKFISDAPKP